MTVKKKQSYIVVLDWMVEKYHLKGNELLAYALIYGFSQDEESEYKGSYSYICKWLSIDRATAIRILNRLESKGLLTKRQELVGGKATWRIEFPIVVSYESSQGVESTQKLLATVLVCRASTAKTPRGVVIQQVVLKRDA